jgi:hypothetical protein
MAAATPGSRAARKTLPGAGAPIGGHGSIQPSPSDVAPKKTSTAPSGGPLFKLPGRTSSPTSDADRPTTARDADPERPGSQPPASDGDAPPEQQRFGSPPSLTTDPGEKKTESEHEGIPVPPETLPAESVGETTKETMAAAAREESAFALRPGNPFPPVTTPAALRGLVGGPIGSFPPEGVSRTDLGWLQEEKRRPLWPIALAFVIAAALGLAATVFIARLIA